MQNEWTLASRIGEDRIREAFQYAASGMAITDLNGRFQETNPAYRGIVGRSQEELDSESILSITHEDDRKNCRDNLQRLLAGEVSSFVLEKRYIRPDSSVAWVRNSFSLLKDEHEHPSHIILICNDITEQRRAEQLLVQNEKLTLVGQLASSIAHEINNPLESTLNLLYLIRQAEDLEQARQYALQAEDEIQRAAHIASGTLNFHKQQTRPVLTRMAELLDSVLALFKGKLASFGIETTVEKRDNPELICYPGELRQVLANLIRNAIESMPLGGRLKLRLRRSTDWRTGSSGVRITVADTGHGMSPATRRQIYEPFFTTKGALGTGLGLWITGGLIAKHGGSLHVRSTETPGNSGTAFNLIVPDPSAGKNPE